jgi:hypothetical protein
MITYQFGYFTKLKKIKIKIIKIIKIKALPGICKSAVQASFNKMVFVSCPSLFIICNEGR